AARRVGSHGILLLHRMPALNAPDGRHDEIERVTKTETGPKPVQIYSLWEVSVLCSVNLVMDRRRSRASVECGTLSALPLSHRDYAPGWNRTNASRLECEVTALCSVGSGYGAWQVAVPVGAEAPSFEAK